VGKAKGTNDESVEERNFRLEKQREYMRAYRKNKSSERKKKELSTHITFDMSQL
jgi:hypothetical protein